MWIQLLLVTAVAVLGLIMMRRTGADSHLAIRRLGMAFFTLAAILAILFPQWLTAFARLIGVGRGADLLLYALVVVFLAFVYTQYRRNLTHQRQLTLLVRHIALMSAARAEQMREPRADE